MSIVPPGRVSIVLREGQEHQQFKVLPYFGK
jgi:hypothetical protein